MSTIYFTADTHFDHKFIAELRGFNSKEEHDRFVIDQWNSQITKHDAVWLLGDVGMGKFERFSDQLSELRGTINVIMGNHDACNPMHKGGWNVQRKWLEYVNSVQPFAKLHSAGKRLLLSHYPYHDPDEEGPESYTQYRFRDFGIPLVHGHTHGSERLHGPGKQMHVGLDAWELQLVDIDTVQSGLDNLE